jgi:hypothetical protein
VDVQGESLVWVRLASRSQSELCPIYLQEPPEVRVGPKRKSGHPAAFATSKSRANLHYQNVETTVSVCSTSGGAAQYGPTKARHSAKPTELRKCQRVAS